MEREDKSKKSNEDSYRLDSIRQRFETLLENTNDAIFLLNSENDTILYANAKASELFGYNKEEFYTKVVQDLIAPEDHDDSILKTKELKEGKILPIYERTLLNKNGERILAEINISRFFDQISKITVIQSIIRNITDRKIIEEAILRERQIFHSIALNAVESSSYKDFCLATLENLLKFLKFDFGTIRLLDKNSGEFNLVAELNVPEKITTFFSNSNFKTEEQFISKILASKKTLLVEDFENTNGLKLYKENLHDFKISSLVIVPILNNESGILGLMQLSSYTPHKFSRNTVELLDSVAVMFAAALEKHFAESALKVAYDNQQELNRIISSSPAIVFLWRNAEGWPVEYVSDNISFYGYTPEDFYSGRIPFSSIIYEDDLERISNEVSKYSADSNRRDFSQEYRIISKSGKIHWITDYTTIRKNSEGEITHFHGIILDNTEKKITEESLKSERAALEIIANATAVSSTIPELSQTILKDLTNYLDYDIGIVNLYDPETNELIPVGDYKAKEILGDPLPIVKIDDEGYLITYAARTKKAIFSPDISKFSIDETIKTTVKKLKIKSAIIWPILKANNELLAILQLGSFKIMNIKESQKLVFNALAGTLSNNFERILVEEEKRASDERFRAFVEQSIGGVFLFNINGKIFFVNKRMTEITGYSIQEISNMKIGDFLGKIHPYLVTAGTNTIDVSPIIEDNITVTNEYQVTTKDGTKKWVMVNLNPFKINNENYFAALMVDISKEKLAEQKLKELNRDLERRVKERTSQLEILNKELEAFSYSVSHDLRTPLRSISGFSHALSVDYTDVLDDIGQDYLRRIRDSTKRMSDLIDDILALSRLSRKDMKIENIDLTKLANHIFEELKQQQPERKLKIKIKKNMKVNGDIILLRQLLENLFNNAWKFTQKTKNPTIEFGSKENENEIIFYVKDNGIGFDMTYKDKLFEVFQRLHRKDEFEGTGVGLANVKRIIERHNGKVWAESELFKGATFFFSLPKEL